MINEQLVSSDVMQSDIKRNRGRHSCESRNPEENWIPGHARNDKLSKTFIVMYNSESCQFGNMG